MDKAIIISRVGAAQYADASRTLVEIAKREDYGTASCPQGPDLPHEISDYIWDSELPTPEKIKLFFQVYDDLPCYGLLMYAKHHYGEWSETEKSTWWRLFRERTVSDTPRPLIYSLWCDFFEDPETVGESVSALTESANARWLRVLLPITGPVPWRMKLGLFEDAVKDPDLHNAALQGLVGGAFDYFGDIDREAAMRLLGRLDVEKDETYERLQAKLAG